ncbi:hypothetical protein DPMN_075525 [Dreissena polymorpha]|uniref:Uncharacterized protein n=1 Tax=Dreissena polymorpha TaxID=45954 RepID=A0A9D4BMR4_DREPO|nr:hypothetical protein DPMN_075525 [Dreissena polymorpha]
MSMVHVPVVFQLLKELKRQEELMEPQDIVKRRVFDDNGDSTIGYRIQWNPSKPDTPGSEEILV